MLRRLSLAALLGVCLVSCSPSADGGIDVGPSDAGARCAPGQVEACPCGSGSGQRSCSASGWSECDCGPAPTTGTIVRPQNPPATATAPGQDKAAGPFCKAGFYTGTFEGESVLPTDLVNADSARAIRRLSELSAGSAR